MTAPPNKYETVADIIADRDRLREQSSTLRALLENAIRCLKEIAAEAREAYGACDRSPPCPCEQCAAKWDARRLKKALVKAVGK